MLLDATDETGKPCLTLKQLHLFFIQQDVHHLYSSLGY